MCEWTTAEINLIVTSGSSICAPLCWSKRTDVRHSCERDLSQPRMPATGTGPTDFDLA
jgi:hypothetical protein